MANRRTSRGNDEGIKPRVLVASGFPRAAALQLADKACEDVISLKHGFEAVVLPVGGAKAACSSADRLQFGRS